MMRWPVMVATIAAAVTAEGWPMLDAIPTSRAAPYDVASPESAQVSAITPRVIDGDPTQRQDERNPRASLEENPPR